MNFRRHKLSRAAIWASGIVLLAAPARARDGVNIQELSAWPAISMGDLVARSLVAGNSGVLPVAQPVKGGVSVEDLLRSGPEPMADLVARVNGAKPKAPAAALAPVVTVTIPEAKGEPLAELAAPESEPRKISKEDVTELVIASLGGKVTFTPKSLSFATTGSKAKISVAGKGLEGLALFVRDKQVADLKQAAGEIVARSQGVTELYAVVGGKMYIVPVTVVGAPNGLDLKVPDALVSLEGVFQGSLQSALYPGLEQASQQPAGKDETTGEKAPSLNDSLAETARSVMREDAALDHFAGSGEKLAYKPVTIQLVDERSSPAEGKIFPVSGARVHLIGTEFTAKVDATGHLTIRDMPAESRFFVAIDDPNGQVRPAIAELRTGSAAESGVVRIKAMRNFTFDALTEVSASAQQAGLGSYCASVVDRDQSGMPAAGVAVQLDTQGDGPFYFNSYGFMDRALNATGPDGRFCYFNLVPGPMALTLYQDQSPVATLPVASFTGRHVEETLTLNSEVKLATRLATMASAHEQLSSDVRLANSYKTIDAIDMIPLGTQDPMAQLGYGVLQAADGLLPRGGRVWTFAQAAEFEPAVYQFAAAAANHVAPLIPRGFVEDMAIYAQVSYNPELGVVLVEYGTPPSVAGEGISLKLVDQDGRDMGDGWYFADTPTTKAIFFNVPAGAYSLLVETSDGYWLGSDTVLVYNETVSYVRMGNALRYRP